MELQPTLPTQRFGRKRARHGLAVQPTLTFEITSSSAATAKTKRDNMATLVLAEHHKTKINTPHVSIGTAAAAAASILQHGEAVHIIISDSTEKSTSNTAPNSWSLEFLLALLCEAGLCPTDDAPALLWLQARYSYLVTHMTSAAINQMVRKRDDVVAAVVTSSSLLCWSEMLFPLGAEIHETLRTTNGINFSDAAKETVTVHLPTLPSIEIMQSSADEFDGLGAVVWQCGEVLCNFFDSREGRAMLQNQNVYDLGCGTGLVGIVAVMCGAKCVMLSDRKNIVELAEANAKRMFQGLQGKSSGGHVDESAGEGGGGGTLEQIKYEVFEWKEEEERKKSPQETQETQKTQETEETEEQKQDSSSFGSSSNHVLQHDVVVVSDGLYDQHSFEGLLATIQKLSLANKTTSFLFGYKMRHPTREHYFFQKLVSDVGLELKVYEQSQIYPVHLRGTGIFIVEAALPFEQHDA